MDGDLDFGWLLKKNCGWLLKCGSLLDVDGYLRIICGLLLKKLDWLPKLKYEQLSIVWSN